MSKHDMKILEIRKLSESQITMLLQCCDDPMGWHTLYVTPGTTPDLVVGWVADRMAYAKVQHEAMLVARSKLNELA